jgi:hypothetical protein
MLPGYPIEVHLRFRDLSCTAIILPSRKANIKSASEVLGRFDVSITLNVPLHVHHNAVRVMNRIVGEGKRYLMLTQETIP